MLYYQLKFDQLPIVTFAHIFTKVNYFSELNGGSNCVEIVYIEKGPVNFETNGIIETINENSILLAFKKNMMKFRPLKDTVHTHYTVNIQFDHELINCNGADEIAELPANVMILPLYITLNKNTDQLKVKLKEILEEYNSFKVASSFKCSAMAVDLLSDISISFVAQMKEIDMNYKPSQFLLSNQIKKYISNNINKNISLTDIAVSLNKTPNYLNYLFKITNGITIKQYINKEKISMVMQLISNYHITLKEAGQFVGIYDQNYLSRLFKKITLMSAKKFIKNSFIMK